MCAAACFLALDAATGVIAGCFTPAAVDVALGDLPEPLAKRLPR